MVRRIGVLGVGSRAERPMSTHRDGERSFRGAGSRWGGVGFSLSPLQEAYDAELTVIMMGLRILAQR